MSNDAGDLGRQTRRLKSVAIYWIVGSAVLILVIVAIMSLSIIAPRLVEDAEVADQGSVNAPSSLQGVGEDSGKSAVQVRNDRIRQQAQGYAERYEREEYHTLGRADAFVLEKERDIDIVPQIDEFAQVRKEWEGLIGNLLVSHDGKRLAQKTELLEAFIDLYSKRPMRREWANAMRQQLDILLQPVIDTIPHKYSQRPGEELENEVREVASRLATSATEIKDDILAMRGLVLRAPSTIPADAPTLAEAIMRYDAQRHAQDLLDKRDVKKQAEEEAKRLREEEIRQKQKEAMAISEDLNEQADELQKQLGQLAEKKDEIEKQQEKLERNRVEVEATDRLIQERKRQIYGEMKEAVQYATPSRAELEAGAKRSFALASCMTNPRSADASRRGGVLHKEYNGLIAPRGTEPCQIWWSADKSTVFVHSGGETLALSASSVKGIVYPAKTTGSR